MFRKNAEPDALQMTIDNLLARLAEMNPETAEYGWVVGYVTDLHALKTNESKNRVSKETIATITANLAGIAMILGHERTGVVASKALGFVMKLK